MAASNGSSAAAARGSARVNRPFKAPDTVVNFAHSGGRSTALTLIVAILFARMLLSGQAAAVWKALWGPTKPLFQTSKSGNDPVANSIGNNPQSPPFTT